MSERKQIVVVGSLNMDLVVRTAHLPTPGQTIRGRNFETIPGGKGANQAVAAARLAGPDVLVAMVGRVGEDSFGDALLASLRDAGANVDEVRRASAPTGNAMIAVEESGENFIIITAGANGTLAADDMDAVSSILQNVDVLLLQLEVPMPVVERAAALASAGGATVILNPAPAPDAPLPASLLQHVSILIPNESEAKAMAGVQDPVAAAQTLRGLNVPTVILTMGDEGAMIVSEAGEEQIPTFAITPVDTTAAGDAFVGGLAVALAEGRSLHDAVRFACGAGALSATKSGAQPSLPHRDDLQRFISQG